MVKVLIGGTAHDLPVGGMILLNSRADRTVGMKGGRLQISSLSYGRGLG